MFFSLSLRRALLLVTLVGAAAFAGSYGALTVFAAGWAATLVPSLPESTVIGVLAAVVAQAAMILTGAVVIRAQGREITQVRTAIDSMAQGLCMFDANERLVVCNAQYYQMYELTADEVKPGATLSEVLAKRVDKGTFSRDPQGY